MNSIDSMREEFVAEVATTRRVLERIPADKLGWKPHARSMTLGQLAFHIATVPGGIARITKPESFDVSKNNFDLPQPASLEQVRAAFEVSVSDAEKALEESTESNAEANWHLLLGEKEILCMPRASAWRALMLNHWYHHRGQLSVYLRMLDVPICSIYGPSADENPFA